MDNSSQDQREPHQLDPPQFLTEKELFKKTGVEYFKLNADSFKEDG